MAIVLVGRSRLPLPLKPPGRRVFFRSSTSHGIPAAAASCWTSALFQGRSAAWPQRYASARRSAFTNAVSFQGPVSQQDLDPASSAMARSAATPAQPAATSPRSPAPAARPPSPNPTRNRSPTLIRSRNPYPQPQPATQVFDRPQISGLPIDICAAPKQQCAGEAATLFCQQQGYQYAQTHSHAVFPTTAHITGGQCVPELLKVCGGYTRIVCAN